MPAFDGLRERVHPSTVFRAEQLVKEGRVLEFAYRDPRTIVGLIQGAKSAPYRCMLRLDPEEPEIYVAASHCSCYVGGDCPHAVALLMLAQSARERESIGSASGTALDRWLRAVQGAVAPTADDLTHTRLTYITYVLRPSQPGLLQRTIVLTLWQSRKRKDGALGRLQTFEDNDKLALDAADEAIVANLRRHHGAAATPWSHAGELDHEMVVGGPALLATVKAMVATGRCRWADVEGPLVRWGAPRHGDAAWRLEGHGLQRLGLQLTSAATHVVLTEPAVYFDCDGGCAGELALSVPDGLLAHLENAPAIGPESVDAFCEALPQALHGVVPLPRRFVVHDEQAIPMPVLHVDISARADGKPYVRGELCFAYGEGDAQAQVAGDAADAAVWLPHPDPSREVILRMPRRHGDEASARQRLIGHGAQPLSRGAWRFDLGDASDLQDLYATVHTTLRPLQKAGFHIAGEDDLQRDVFEGSTVPAADIEPAERPGWFALDLGIDVDGARVPLVPLLMRALQVQAWGLDATSVGKRAHVYLPLPDGRVLAVPLLRIRAILRVLAELYGVYERAGDSVSIPLASASELAAMAREGHLLWHGGDGLLRFAQALHDGPTPEPLASPYGLRATLRGYQLQGLSWLQFLRSHKLGGVLADDMGLGKTLQTLAHIQLEKEAGRLHTAAMVVTPTSVLGNWVHEAARFTPSLRVHAYHGAGRDLEAVPQADVVLTTYGVFLRDEAQLTARDFALVVLDEAQVIKNANTRLHAAIRGVKASHRLCLTGTPLQNNLQELWALFNFAMPGIMGDAATFRQTFAKPIESDGDVARQGALLRRIKPFLLRRAKDEVTRELPPKTEIVQSVALSGKQRDLYEAVRAAVDERVRKEVKSRGLARSSIVILDALLKLRQVCCDPRLVKLDAARQVFQSAKLLHLFEILPQLLAEKRRILLFSQFTGMLDLISQELLRRGIEHLTLTGRTRNRQAVIERFQEGGAPLFLISLKAGGTGFNLPQADTVIHYDPWWNPAAEDQATDRAHRLGQTKPVFVYRFIVENSVEMKMVQMQQRKRALFEAMVSGGKLSNILTEDDLEDLFAPL